MEWQDSDNAGLVVYSLFTFDVVGGIATWNWQYSPKEGGIFSTTVRTGALQKIIMLYVINGSI